MKSASDISTEAERLKKTARFLKILGIKDFSILEGDFYIISLEDLIKRMGLVPKYVEGWDIISFQRKMAKNI